MGQDGRFIILYCEIQGQPFLLVNVYAPNHEYEQIAFYDKVFQEVLNIDIDTDTIIIWGGDFNCHLSSLDADGGSHSRKLKTIAKLESIMDAYDICDIWRIRNPTCKTFTWRSLHPLIQRRLDYFLISNKAQTLITACSIIPSVHSDHSAVFLHLKNNCNSDGKGPSHWKINNNILSDSNYVSQVRNNIVEWQSEIDSVNSVLLWEYIKYKVRMFTIEFCKMKLRKEKQQRSNLEKTLKNIESSLNKNSSFEMKEEYIKAKNELDKYYENDTNGQIVRSRLQWVEDGERSTKYFLNLEKENKKKSTVRTLLINGIENSNPSDIMKHLKQSFVKKFKRVSKLSEEECDSFLEKIPNKKLNEDDALLCDGNITLDELHKALLSMKNNKTPGNDGLSKEFYVTFFPELGQLLLDCLNTNFEVGSLSESQKQAIITLIQKPGKDMRYLNAWRPISLLNVDTKLLSKILVSRLLKVLPSIIESDQYAFVKNRFIGEPLRLVQDILYYTDKYDIEGIMFAADLEAAFDSLDHQFLLSVLKYFGFKSNFIKWIKILHHNIQSTIVNNGFTTGYFILERGTRQGDPLACYLFIISMEILATLIRNNQDIAGINIHGLEVKICMFADDTTIFVKNEQSLKAVLKVLSEFAMFSSLNINKNKSNAA